MRDIFALQARGKVDTSIHSVSELEDPLLVGVVLAQRYLGRYYHPTVGELSDWLSEYGDQPDAAAVRALLLKHDPKTSVMGLRPSVERTVEADPVPEDIDPPRNDLVRNSVLDRTVQERAQRGNAGSALRLVTATRGISAAYAAQLRAEIAQVLFIRNEDVDALRVARMALNDTAAADQPSLGFYIGGLAAWRLNRIELAGTLFEGGANARNTSARVRAASAFWASRVSRSVNDAAGTVKWLAAAAEERLTLHGLLARRILRMETGIVPGGALLSQADVDAVAATSAGRRAFALLQIGQADRAEAELRALWADGGAGAVFGRSLLMVASAAGLANFAARVADRVDDREDRRRDGARVAMPLLRPAGGFKIDPALVYALTRIESNFDSAAVSAAGARGLMQIMPATAQYILGDTLYSASRLHEPASNLDIGQRYIGYLAGQDGIDHDLLRIIASYNCGPGSFFRWGGDLHDQGDPLLFIEAIPIPETRAFVQHALVYSWIYAARMHLPATSLDALSVGEFPRFDASRFAGPQRRAALSAAGFK